LLDIGRDGKDRDWNGRKAANIKLAAVYNEICNEKKAERLEVCSHQLIFDILEDSSKRLKGMTSCRVRLCPICSWRRSLKLYHQTEAIALHLGEKYRYIMVTLTVRNCPGHELKENLDNLFQSLNRFNQLKAIKAAWKGWARGVEITHNMSDETFHPHVHIVVAVNPSYFNSRDYISQKDLQEMWRKSARLDYDPIVDVRRIKGLPGAVAEVSKYAAKPGEYIIEGHWDLTCDTVAVLDDALAHRRLAAYGGVFREVHRLLKQDDPEDGDLVDVGEPDSGGEVKWLEVYNWLGLNRGYMGGRV